VAFPPCVAGFSDSVDSVDSVGSAVEGCGSIQGKSGRSSTPTPIISNVTT